MSEVSRLEPAFPSIQPTFLSWINGISPGPIGDMFMNECEQVFIIQKYGQLICAKCAHYHSCDSKLQPAPETWWCPAEKVFSIFFKVKMENNLTIDRCPARVKMLQEQISRPIDADTHCYRVNSCFDSYKIFFRIAEGFYLYKTANSSGKPIKSTHGTEMANYGRNIKESFSWRNPLLLDCQDVPRISPEQTRFSFVTDAKCCTQADWTFSKKAGALLLYKPLGMEHWKKAMQP